MDGGRRRAGRCSLTARTPQLSTFDLHTEDLHDYLTSTSSPAPRLSRLTPTSASPPPPHRRTAEEAEGRGRYRSVMHLSMQCAPISARGGICHRRLSPAFRGVGRRGGRDGWILLGERDGNRMAHPSGTNRYPSKDPRVPSVHLVVNPARRCGGLTKTSSPTVPPREWQAVRTVWHRTENKV